MKESDTIYWQDHRGVIQSMSVKEYEHNTRSRAVIDERLGLVARWQTPDIRSFPEDVRPGEPEPAAREGARESICETGGESPSEISHQKPIYKVEK